MTWKFWEPQVVQPPDPRIARLTAALSESATRLEWAARQFRDGKGTATNSRLAHEAALKAKAVLEEVQAGHVR